MAPILTSNLCDLKSPLSILLYTVWGLDIGIVGQLQSMCTVGHVSTLGQGHPGLPFPELCPFLRLGERLNDV